MQKAPIAKLGTEVLENNFFAIASPITVRSPIISPDLLPSASPRDVPNKEGDGALGETLQFYLSAAFKAG